MNFVSEKSISLNELMRINDFCRKNLSDRYMLTPSSINYLAIKINGLTIKEYNPPVASEIRSFMECVLPKEPKGIATKVKNWILFNLCQRRRTHYPEIFAYLDQEFKYKSTDPRKNS